MCNICSRDGSAFQVIDLLLSINSAITRTCCGLTAQTAEPGVCPSRAARLWLIAERKWTLNLKVGQNQWLLSLDLPRTVDMRPQCRYVGACSLGQHSSKSFLTLPVLLHCVCILFTIMIFIIVKPISKNAINVFGFFSTIKRETKTALIWQHVFRPSDFSWLSFQHGRQSIWPNAQWEQHAVKQSSAGLLSGPHPLYTGQEVSTGLHFLPHPKSRRC